MSGLEEQNTSLFIFFSSFFSEGETEAEGRGRGWIPSSFRAGHGAWHGPYLTSLWSWPKLRTRVRGSTDWAMQVPLKHTFSNFHFRKKVFFFSFFSLLANVCFICFVSYFSSIDDSCLRTLLSVCHILSSSVSYLCIVSSFSFILLGVLSMVLPIHDFVFSHVRALFWCFSCFIHINHNFIFSVYFISLILYKISLWTSSVFFNVLACFVTFYIYIYIVTYMSMYI